MAFTSMSVMIQSPPGNAKYCFQICEQIYHLVAPLHPNEAHKPGYGQLHIFYSAETTSKWLKNQSSQGHMAKVLQWLHVTS
jgi:hypothetical protein